MKLFIFNLAFFSEIKISDIKIPEIKMKPSVMYEFVCACVIKPRVT